MLGTKKSRMHANLRWSLMVGVYSLVIMEATYLGPWAPLLFLGLAMVVPRRDPGVSPRTG